MDASLRRDFYRRLIVWARRAGRTDARRGALVFTLEEIDRERERFHALHDRRRVFRQLATHAISPEQRRTLILRTARELGSKGLELWRDSRALSRWFDESTLLERFERQLAACQRRIDYLCGQLGGLAATRIRAASEPAQRRAVWTRLGLEDRLRGFLDPDWDARVGTSALNCWSCAVEALEGGDRRAAFSSRLRQLLTRIAQDRRESVWKQVAALDLLALLERDPLRIILQQKLATPAAGDDLFVREHVVQLIGRLAADSDEIASLLGLATADPSPFVRQSVAFQLGRLPIDMAADYWLELAQDDAREVRGAAFDAVPHLVSNRDLALWLGSCVRKVLPQESDPVIARIGIESLVRSYAELIDAPELAEDWWRDAREILAEVEVRAQSTALRRWAAAGSEALWVARDPASSKLLSRLQADGVMPPPGRSRSLPKRFFAEFDAATIGRVLSFVAQSDYPLEVERGRWRDRLTRGFRFRFRLWRLLHELRHPAPDKRQGFRHTIGRVHYGTIRAPSSRLAELAETKVPGEPLYIAAEDGWRPYLPLLDDCLSLLNQGGAGRPTSFYSSQGVTEVYPPPTLGGRLRAWWKISRNYAAIARLRNWNEGDAARPTTFVATLEELGFRFEFSEHAGGAPVEEGPPERPVDDTVRRHFPALAVVAPGDLLEQFLDYSLSLYENTLFDLAVFAAALTLYFLGRHVWTNASLRTARRQLGLVVGGWGTRGKSSVERLKAALFNGLGYGLVSKTTGCEAMILYSPAYGEMRELFLFRPYDKATIWEQRNVTQVAAGLRSDILLWECMGLTPAYVDVLQRQWMRDDLSTLTNTYPDHEDLQGPAGINIPQVMTLFIPTASQLISSEEQMMPILADAAATKGTAASFVGWKEATLIPRDVMARFPYEEHPYNIALVTRMAAELGVGRAFTYKELADRVVPDLGVLKTYPVSRVDGRELEFSNGMSANERHGCLSNWQRLGLDAPDPGDGRGWITTLVNNRADRIPRSRVFAEILVADLSADRHFLIGGNLEGLIGYVDTAWEGWVDKVSLGGEGRSAFETLDSMVTRFRQPRDRAEVARRLAVMLGEWSSEERVGALERLGDDRAAIQRAVAEFDYPDALVDSLLEHHLWNLEVSTEIEALRSRLVAGASAELDGELRGMLRRWFDRKLVVIEDYYATGDEIVRRIAAETPPHVRNHVVGVQNIKGTGLDFVYRWLAWERCHRSCQKILAGDARTGGEGIEELTVFREFGPLCESLVREAVAAVRKNPRSLAGQLAELDAIEAELVAQLSRSGSGEVGAPTRGYSGRALVTLLGHVEDLLDAGDAIRRRKRADQIFRDLISQRVSVPVAIQLLQELTKRQKGGWLVKQLRSKALFARLLS